jgi:hypothetical protein
MKADKRTAARQRAKAALEAEGAGLKAKAVENDLAGEPSIVTNLSELSVRQRKLQSVKGKRRVLSKNEIRLARKRTH